MALQYDLLEQDFVAQITEAIAVVINQHCSYVPPEINEEEKLGEEIVQEQANEQELGNITDPQQPFGSTGA